MFHHEIRSSADNQPPCPAEVMTYVMLEASFGVQPSVDTQEMVELLHLNGDTPDGLTLMDRFIGDKNHGTPDLRSIVTLMAGSFALLSLTNERQANQAEESVARSLGTIATLQVTREGDICPGARAMVLMSERDDIIPSDVRAKVSALPQEPNERGNRFTRRIPGMSLFRNRRRFGNF